jgi:hypothetical protein
MSSGKKLGSEGSLLRSAWNRRFVHPGLRFMLAHDDDVYPAIERTASLCAVAGDGMIFAVTTRGKSLRRKTVLHDKKTNHLGRARRREFPVRGKLGVVDTHIVGMTLDTEIVLTRSEQCGHATESRLGAGFDAG